MKAKFVYEAIGDIFKPKSEEEIISSMGDLSPNELLIKSTKKGFLPGIKKAIEMGANVHAEDDNALLFASLNGHYGVVKLLLDNGADVHAVNDFALRWASVNGHYDVVALLLDNGANVPMGTLRQASANDHYDVIELLKKYMKYEG